MTPNAKEAILRRLAETPNGLAVHEFNIDGVSENSVAARLRELRACNMVVARFRVGKPFKEWLLTAAMPSAAPRPVASVPSEQLF